MLFFSLFTESLKSLRPQALGLSPWKQEVGQQAKEVMLLSVLNCSDGSVLVPGPLLCLLAASSWLTAQQCPAQC